MRDFCFPPYLPISPNLFISFWMGMKSGLVNFRHGTMSRLLNSNFQNRVHISTEHDKIGMHFRVVEMFAGPQFSFFYGLLYKLLEK
jgi:hypothetical protein